MTVDSKLVADLNDLWQQSEGDYNKFDREMREKIAAAFGIPADLLQRKVSFNRILLGDFTVRLAERIGALTIGVIE